MLIFKKIFTLLLSISLIFTSTFNYSQVVFSDEYEETNKSAEEIVNHENETIDTVNSYDNADDIAIDEEQNHEDKFEENIVDESDETINEFNNEVINDEKTIDEDIQDADNSEERYVIPGVIDVDINLDAYSVSKHKSNNLLQANNVGVALPARFDLRDVDGVSYVTEIKDQGNFGSCWAHAIAASAESTSIMDGEKDINFDLSEVSINYFVYNNRYADQLGLVTNDYSYCKNQGDGSNNVFNQGGNLSIAMFNLASGIGFLDENKLPYSSIGDYSSSFKIKTFEDNYINKNNQYEWCYNNDYLLVGVNAFNLVDDRNEVKKQLMANGAMGVSYYSDDSLYLNTSTAGYYCYDEDGSNHAVTLVGWDDDFPKTNFKSKHQPKNNGAWIIKNSWGDYYKYDDGYIYISYEDTSLNSDLAYQFDIEPRDPDKMIYQYDGTFCDWSNSLSSSTHYEANNYTAQRDEYIDSIGFFTSGANVNYTVYVYENNVSSSKPMSGTKLLEQSGNVAYGGFHTVNLDDPVFINKDKDFTIVVKQTGSTDSTELYIDATNNLGWWYGDYSDFSSDQSFYTTSSSPKTVTWDRPQIYVNYSVGYEYGNLRVKGYTNSNLLNSNNTYAYYDENNGLIIHSESNALINKINSITIDDKTISTYEKDDNDIVVSNDTLLSESIDDGKYIIKIETSDGFIKMFEVEILLPILIEGDIYLAFTSDIHNDITTNNNNISSARLNNWLNNVSTSLGKIKFSNFGSCGDMGSAGQTETGYWTSAQKVIDVINNNSNVLGTGFYICGNHEYSPGKFSANKNSTTRLYSPAGTHYDDPNGKYVLYSLGVESWNFNSGYEITQSEINNLATYLENTAPTDRPIFVLSHYPLHYDGTRTIKGMDDTIDVLNQYGEDHTIIFLWGHNHTDVNYGSYHEEHYDIIYTDEIINYDNKKTNKPINFTYAAAGCMSDEENSYGGSKNVLGKGLVAKIYDDKVDLVFYDKNYKQVGDITTITLVGNPSAPRYTVTFDANGGSVSTLTKKVTFEGIYGTLPIPTRDGYTFDGWFTEKTGGSQINSDTVVNITNNQTLYAHWSAHKYTITFNANGGEVSPTSKIVEYNSIYGDLPTPTRNGYTFVGWFKSTTSSTEITKDSKVTITADQTLYAKWNANTYTITYELDGGTAINKTTYTPDTATFTLTNPTKVGYTFTGWSGTNLTGDNNKTVTIAKGSYGNRTYTAHYEVTNYTIKFTSNNSSYGTVSQSNILVPHGTKIKVDGNKLTFGDIAVTANPANPIAKYSYSFNEWSISDGQEVTSALTITASFVRTIRQYTYTFYDDDGTTILKQSTVDYGTTISKPNNPTKEDDDNYTYSFDGWYNAKTDGNKVTSFGYISSDVNYYARYNKTALYSVSFVVNNENYGSISLAKIKVKSGTTFSTASNVLTIDSQKVTATPTQQTNEYTYSFSSWSKTSGTISSNTTITANFVQEKRKYTYTFYDDNDTVIEQSTVDYGTTISKPSDPTKSSTAQYTYTFDGWYDAKTGGNIVTSFGAITSNVNYYARYVPSIRKYTVTFKDYDGSQIGVAQNVNYGSSANAPSNPSRNGYDFAGWDKSFVSVTSNLTVTATYTPTTYTIKYVLDGGKLSAANPSTYTIETNNFSLNNPTKVGYTFAGWTGTELSSATSAVTIEKGSTGNRVYTATYKPASGILYTVKHYKEGLTSNDYSASPEIELLYGTTGASVTPSVKNYEGFNAPAVKTDTIKADGTTVIEYKYTRNSYAVTINKGTGISFTTGAGTYKYGSTVTVSATSSSGYENPIWSGHTFAGNSFTMPATALTLSVSASPKKYVVTFNANGGSVFTQTKEVTYNSTYGTLPTPTRAGYTFDGWYTLTSGGSKIESTTTVTITSNQTLHAHWVLNIEPVTLKSIYVDNPQILYAKKSSGLNSIKVIAKYSDNSTKDVTDSSTIITPDLTTNGKKTVSISYNGLSTSFDIYVFGTKSVSLNLEGRIIINYTTQYPDYQTVGYTPGVLFFKQESAPSQSDIEKAYAANKGVTKFEAKDDALVFKYDKLAAKEMNDDVYIVLYATKDDTVIFGQPQVYSITRYTKDILSKSEDAKMKTLVVDMLNYGSAAQNYFNYKTNAIASSTISSSQSSLGTSTTPSIKKQNVAIKDNLSSSKVSIKTVSLSLDNEISINYNFNVTGSVKRAELLVFDSYRAGGIYNTSTASRKYDAVLDGDVYCGTMPNIVAKQMRKRFYSRLHVVFNDGTEAYGDVIDYSIEDYLYAIHNKSGALQTAKNLAITMMKYGDSASYYFQ